jgi:hypothetical protein
VENRGDFHPGVFVVDHEFRFIADLTSIVERVGRMEKVDGVFTPIVDSDEFFEVATLFALSPGGGAVFGEDLLREIYELQRA